MGMALAIGMIGFFVFLCLGTCQSGKKDLQVQQAKIDICREHVKTPGELEKCLRGME